MKIKELDRIKKQHKSDTLEQHRIAAIMDLKMIVTHISYYPLYPSNTAAATTRTIPVHNHTWNDTHQYTLILSLCSYLQAPHEIAYRIIQRAPPPCNIRFANGSLPVAFGFRFAQRERSPGTFLEQCTPACSKYNLPLGTRWRAHGPFTYAQRNAGDVPQLWLQLLSLTRF